MEASRRRRVPGHEARTPQLVLLLGHSRPSTKSDPFCEPSEREFSGVLEVLVGHALRSTSRRTIRCTVSKSAVRRLGPGRCAVAWSVKRAAPFCFSFEVLGLESAQMLFSGAASLAFYRPHACRVIENEGVTPDVEIEYTPPRSSLVTSRS